MGNAEHQREMPAEPGLTLGDPSPPSDGRGGGPYGQEGDGWGARRPLDPDCTATIKTFQ
jgi:hypothetical protein